MKKNSHGHLSAKTVCRILNTMLKLDPAATNALFQNRVPCNADLAAHPTIVVQLLQEKKPECPDDEKIQDWVAGPAYTQIGVLGVLNACIERGAVIHALYAADPPSVRVHRIVSFQVVQEAKPVTKGKK